VQIRMRPILTSCKQAAPYVQPTHLFHRKLDMPFHVQETVYREDPCAQQWIRSARVEGDRQ